MQTLGAWVAGLSLLLGILGVLILALSFISDIAAFVISPFLPISVKERI